MSSDLKRILSETPEAAILAAIGFRNKIKLYGCGYYSNYQELRILKIAHYSRYVRVHEIILILVNKIVYFTYYRFSFEKLILFLPLDFNYFYYGKSVTQTPVLVKIDTDQFALLDDLCLQLGCKRNKLINFLSSHVLKV